MTKHPSLPKDNKGRNPKPDLLRGNRLGFPEKKRKHHDFTYHRVQSKSKLRVSREANGAIYLQKAPQM